MIQRSSGSEGLEFPRDLIKDHPIGDEQAVLRGLLDDKVLGEIFGPQHTKVSPAEDQKPPTQRLKNLPTT